MIRGSSVVYTSAFNRRWRSEAARGGPVGEILMGDALVDGLQRLGADVTVVDSLRGFARHAVTRAVGGRRFFYFLDPVTLELAATYRLLSARHASKIFVLEWYGTPASRVSRALRGLQPSQYLLPYPADGSNTFLGYVLTNAAGDAIADAGALTAHITTALEQKQGLQGVIWAKEGRYLQGDAGAAVRALAAVCPVHFTIAPERGPNATLPPGATNHGALPRAGWRALLRRSSFVMGLGDPVAGPTALEALLEGCAYLDPRYPSGRAVNGVPELMIQSQHPFASAIGEPFVYGIDLRDQGQVLAAVDRSADAGARAAAVPHLVNALQPFTLRPYLDRLRAILST